MMKVENNPFNIVKTSALAVINSVSAVHPLSREHSNQC